MSTGIDVSSHQGYPDWGAVRGGGIEFAYIKASEGVGWVSPTLDTQFRAARAAGLVTGLYHFARPDTGNAPGAEAETFADQIRPLGGCGPGFLPPCLDIEVTAPDLAGWCGEFIARLRHRLDGDQRVLVYASTNFITAHLGEDWANRHDVWWWVAHYGRRPGQPGHLTPRVVLHQYTSAGAVPGVGGSVDMNVAVRPLGELTEGDDMFTDEDRRRLVEIYEWWQGGSEGVRFAGPHALSLYRIEQVLNEVADLLRPGIEGVRHAGPYALALDKINAALAELRGADTAQE
ncbi:hypothetical protein GCM10012275_19180 [Longimycelium tulufanense]|uniref:Lysozyme n=1 Tax=Longimycelium tulufanense TaxID=907463 RepID=A0A8J3FVX3_9PSEU|nr:glycoside hydrolase family 25 protein [Longimycelium tulufanense]GGM48333.1 hypothetical protein GCM10012275_19180 [Longimycelium tulufanense]